MAATQTPCSTRDPELWWPLSYTASTMSQVNQAKAWCRTCPIQMECLADAIGRQDFLGIWGGYTPAERRRIAREASERAIQNLAESLAHAPSGTEPLPLG